LTSIESASNLLFIESRDRISSYRRGTSEYDEALLRLQTFASAYGDGEEEEPGEQEELPGYDHDSESLDDCPREYPAGLNQGTA